MNKNTNLVQNEELYDDVFMNNETPQNVQEGLILSSSPRLASDLSIPTISSQSDSVESNNFENESLTNHETLPFRSLMASAEASSKFEHEFFKIIFGFLRGNFWIFNTKFWIFITKLLDFLRRKFS